MSLFDGKPIGRIDLYGPRSQRAESAGELFLDPVSMSPVEAERIWDLIKRAAEASNIRGIAEEASAE